MHTRKTEFLLHYSSLSIVLFSIGTTVNLLLLHPVDDLIQKYYLSFPLKKPYKAVKMGYGYLFFTGCDVRAQREAMTPLVPARKSWSWDQKQTLAGLLRQGCPERVKREKWGRRKSWGEGG